MDLTAEWHYLTRRIESGQPALVLLSLFSSWAATERIRSAGLSLLPPPSVSHSTVLSRSLSLASVFAWLFAPVCRSCSVFCICLFHSGHINAILIGVLCPHLCHFSSGEPLRFTLILALSIWSLSLCWPEFSSSSICTFNQEIPSHFSGKKYMYHVYIYVHTHTY